MSQTTTEFFLTYLPGTNPVHYGILIFVNNADYENDPHNVLTENGQMDSQNLLYTTQIDMVGVSDDPVVLEVDLGQLGIHPEDGEIDITLLNGTDQVANVRVKVKDAQDESRPFTLNN